MTYCAKPSELVAFDVVPLGWKFAKSDGFPKRSALTICYRSFEPSKTRTCDPLVKRAVKPITSSHGSLDLLTVFIGCSRFGLHLVTAIHTCLPLFTSQICHKQLGCIPRLRQFRLATLLVEKILFFHTRTSGSESPSAGEAETSSAGEQLAKE